MESGNCKTYRKIFVGIRGLREDIMGGTIKSVSAAGILKIMQKYIKSSF